MTKNRSTKRALLMSGLALLMCVSMLIGSTFAWFTDSVTSSGNKIQSGTLDIVLEMYDKETDTWVDAEGKMIPFVAADGRTEILWEPNCTYEMAPIRIRNAGNLAVYAMVSINGISGDEKLLEAIEFSTVVSNLAEANEKALIQRGMDDVVDGTATISPISGTPWGTLLWDATLMPEGEEYNGLTHISDTLTFVGHMKAEAGNEYQGLSIEGISITVVATQSMYEKDSFGYTYDRYATPPIVTVVRNAAELTKAVAAGGDIVLSNDIALTASVTAATDVTISLNGHKIASKGIKATSNLDMSNGKVTMSTTSGYIDIRPTEDSAYTFENVNFVNEYKRKTNYGAATDRIEPMIKLTAMTDGVKTTFVFENCVFDNASISFAGLSGSTGAIDVTFKNCTFNAMMGSDPVIDIGNHVTGTVNIENCTFNITGTNSYVSVVDISNSSNTTVTVNATDNTLNANKAVAYTYDPAKGETEVDSVKLGTSNVRNYCMFDFRLLHGGYSTINETGTILQGDIAVPSLKNN